MRNTVPICRGAYIFSLSKGRGEIIIKRKGKQFESLWPRTTHWLFTLHLLAN
jgi:hypothetical protein